VAGLPGDEPLPNVNDKEAFVERVVDGALDALGAWQKQKTAVSQTSTRPAVETRCAAGQPTP
jgi:hypothetical protein